MKIFSYIFYFLHFIQMFITVAFVIILMFVFNKFNHPIRKKWAQFQLRILGIRLKIEGNIDETADLFLLNHQSLLDIIVLETISKRNIAWVAKKEIANLPFFGHILTLPKMIIIDRENKTGLTKLVKEVKNRLNNKRPVAIFPEGTRGQGDKLLKFKSGAKIVAQKHGLKVQPIILTHTREILDSKSLRAKPGVVKVIFLPSIEASKETSWFENTEELMNKTFLEANQSK
jgi:1-acyl-sn-glycerol-3-phosphate acyltransferase